MAAKYANQNIIVIKKTPVKKDFLQISNEEWMKVAKDCDRSFSAFKLFLYLASNEVGYELGLSQAAVEKELGIKKTGYYSSIKLLQDLGYLKDLGNNRMEFYTKSYFSAETENSASEEKFAQAENNKKLFAQTEKFALEENSVKAENSAGTEKVYETFNF